MDNTALLLEIKSELSKLSTTLENVKQDVDDLKSLMNQVVRLEEKQLEIEKNQQKLFTLFDEVNEIKTSLIVLKKDVDNLYHDKKKKELKEEKLKDRLYRFSFNLLERVVFWLISFLFLVYTFINEFFRRQH